MSPLKIPHLLSILPSLVGAGDLCPPLYFGIKGVLRVSWNAEAHRMRILVTCA